MTFPYPGDEPAALSSAAWVLSRAEGQLAALGRAVQASRSQLGDVWEGDLAERANADLSRMATALPQLTGKLTEARFALDDYRSALISIRAEIDDLRKQHQNLSEALAAQEYEQARAGSDGSTAPADIHSVEVAGRAAHMSSRIDSLRDEYEGLVTRASQAAQVCEAALRIDSRGRPDGPRAGLPHSSDAPRNLAADFGLDRLAMTHLELSREQTSSFDQFG